MVVDLARDLKVRAGDGDYLSRSRRLITKYNIKNRLNDLLTAAARRPRASPECLPQVGKNF